MSTGIDKHFIVDYYHNMTDEQIINALTKDFNGLTLEAKEIVNEEIKRRNLNPEISKFLEVEQDTYLHIPKAYDPDGCPVDEDTRIWIEQSFNFLINYEYRN